MIIIIWKFLTSVPYDGTAAGHCFKPSLWASETVHAYIHIPPNLRLLTSFCNVVNMYKSTNLIRKYGSTFYIGIAMVVLPYFGPWEN